MAAGSENAPGRAETVHHSSRTRVTRLSINGRTVVRKEPLSPDAEHRLRHETAMLERLRGIEGIAQLAPGPPPYPESIVLADAGPADLAGLAKPLAAAGLIDLAVRLARAVADMHRQEVIHRDISPSNIVLSADGVPCLVDFALATSFAQIRLEFTHHSEIAGTIAYMAPEQTGRTGRGVDHRRHRHRGAGSAARDHHAPAGKGARQPLPVGGRRGVRPGAAAERAGGRAGSGSASMTFRSGCCRRRG
jgi:Protein kinase domain